VDEAEAEKIAAEKAAEAAKDAANKDPTKFAAKKSKATAKAGTQTYQWDIMKSSGIGDDEIPPFADPYHWLEYFPPLAKRDVTAMGCQVDWRRSFITTDHNPFYDAFVRWQFNTLKKIGKVIKAKRMAVYSPLDGQPCADHDRASGEGVGPQEYTLIKMEAYQESLVGELAPLAGKKVYLAAATLRPETMYGQTNCWVLPDGDYGAFEMADGSVLVMCDRAARNLAYQEHTAQPGVSVKLLGFKGQALIGCAVKSPLAVLPKIYCLPMLTILMNKGTGVVTSVPSDSPADFMALSDLKAKPPMREKFGVKDEWVMPFEVVPCVRIEEFGDACAPVVCERLKIKSQNDKVKLEEAKHQTYLKGFTDGVMLLGAFKGKPVKEVKTTIRDVMIDAGEAIVYSEPEKQVMSRSGDECVVALTDQWYLEYGEEQWRARAEKCLAGMNTYHDEARRAFESTLGWLRQWACSRSFGLGTRVPWDAEFLIESLSDSTIYMAYYTGGAPAAGRRHVRQDKAQRVCRADDRRGVGRGVSREGARRGRRLPRGAAGGDEGGVRVLVPVRLKSQRQGPDPEPPDVRHLQPRRDLGERREQVAAVVPHQRPSAVEQREDVQEHRELQDAETVHRGVLLGRDAVCARRRGRHHRGRQLRGRHR
jgi:leucyl-tRNA synthetase